MDRGVTTLVWGVIFICLASVAGADEIVDSEVERGCSLASEKMEVLLPTRMAIRAIEEVSGLRVSYQEHCLKVAKTILQFMKEGRVRVDSMTIGTDGDTLPVNKKAYLRDFISILGPNKSKPEEFARSDGKCPVLLSKEEPPVDNPVNCGVGCIYHYLNGNDRDLFFGFYAGWQIYYQAARYSQMGSQNDFFGKALKFCVDIRHSGNVASCAIFECSKAHRSYVDK